MFIFEYLNCFLVANGVEVFQLDVSNGVSNTCTLMHAHTLTYDTHSHTCMRTRTHKTHKHTHTHALSLSHARTHRLTHTHTRANAYTRTSTGKDTNGEGYDSLFKQYLDFFGF